MLCSRSVLRPDRDWQLDASWIRCRSYHTAIAMSAGIHSLTATYWIKDTAGVQDAKELWQLLCFRYRVGRWVDLCSCLRHCCFKESAIPVDEGVEAPSVSVPICFHSPLANENKVRTESSADAAACESVRFLATVVDQST